MSLINDALKQAKRESQEPNSNPESSGFSGGSPAGTVPSASSSGGGYRVVKIIAVIIIAIAVIAIAALNAYYLFSGGNNEQEGDASAVESDNKEQKGAAEAKTPIEKAENTAEKVTKRGRKDSGRNSESSSAEKAESEDQKNGKEKKKKNGSQKIRDELLSKISITGVVSSGDNAMAIINGEVVKAGESINGVTLEKIGDNDVFIRYNDQEFAIPKP